MKHIDPTIKNYIDNAVTRTNKNIVNFSGESMTSRELSDGVTKIYTNTLSKKVVFETIDNNAFKSIYIEPGKQEIQNLKSIIFNNTNKISGISDTAGNDSSVALSQKALIDVQEQLDNKADKEDLDAEIENRIAADEALDESKADVNHTHTISDVTGLQTALDNKSDVNHTHAISDVTGLQTALDSKTPLFTYNTVQAALNDWSNIADGSCVLAGNGPENYDATYIFKINTFRALMIAANKVPKNYIWIRPICKSNSSPVSTNLSDPPFRKIPVLTTNGSLDISGNITSPTITNLQTSISNKADASHNHDSSYAAINHTHDNEYAPIYHEHEYLPSLEVDDNTFEVVHWTITSDCERDESYFNIDVDAVEFTTSGQTIDGRELVFEMNNTSLSFSCSDRTTHELYLFYNAGRDETTSYTDLITLIYTGNSVEDNEYHAFKINGSMDLTFNFGVLHVENYNITRSQENSYTHIQENVLNLKNMLNIIYPVGSIYTSMNNANPHDLFGFGIWQQITDRFLYCADSSGVTGGSKKITVDNLPAHNHSVNINTNENGAHIHNIYWTDPNNVNGYNIVNGNAASGTYNLTLGLTYNYNANDKKNSRVKTVEGEGAHTHNVNGSTENTGSGTDYMPEYMTVYAWYRTA